MSWVQYLLDALSTQTRPASLVIPKRGNGRIYYSIKKQIYTMMQLLHLIGLEKQMASFHKPENHGTTELQQPGGVSSPFSTPDTTKFAHLTVVTLKEADAYRCYLPLKRI